AEPLEVLEFGAAGEEIEGDVQDMIGLVVGEMAFEQVQVAIDVGDQSGPACQQEHGADAAGAQALDPPAQFVMDVVGGDHGALALGAGAVFDPAKDSPLALPEFVEDIGFHSRVSVVWPNADMRLPPLLPNHRGFSSFLRQMSLRELYITLGSGLKGPETAIKFLSREMNRIPGFCSTSGWPGNMRQKKPRAREESGLPTWRNLEMGVVPG